MAAELPPRLEPLPFQWEGSLPVSTPLRLPAIQKLAMQSLQKISLPSNRQVVTVVVHSHGDNWFRTISHSGDVITLTGSASAMLSPL